MTTQLAINLAELVPQLRPSGRYHIGPCPFCGGRDRFNVKRTDSGDVWLCRQCAPGKYQDAAAFLMRRDGLNFGEVVRRYGDGTTPPRASASPAATPAASPDLDRPPGQTWQDGALAAIEQAQRELWQTAAGDAVLRYLTERRGLSADTIVEAGLGFNPAWCEVPGCGWLAPGIVLPGVVGGAVWYVQVRTTEAARAQAERRGRPLGKYKSLAGSRLRALYGADRLLTARQALICEGEFDALLLSEYLPPNWAAVTMGSAGTLPGVAHLAYFAPVRRAWALLDNDEAGRAGLARWRGLLRWVERAPLLPDGHKDPCAAWQAGADLAAWLAPLTDGRAARFAVGDVLPTAWGGLATVTYHHAGRVATAGGHAWEWDGQRLVMPAAEREELRC